MIHCFFFVYFKINNFEQNLDNESLRESRRKKIKLERLNKRIDKKIELINKQELEKPKPSEYCEENLITKVNLNMLKFVKFFINKI